MNGPRRLVFRPGARAEIREARRWYEREVPGLGRRFLVDFDATVENVLPHPSIFPAVEGGNGVRRVLLRRFPYSLVYDVTVDAIVILACVHHRRHPDAWRTPPR